MGAWIPKKRIVSMVGCRLDYDREQEGWIVRPDPAFLRTREGEPEGEKVPEDIEAAIAHIRRQPSDLIYGTKEATIGRLREIARLRAEVERLTRERDEERAAKKRYQKTAGEGFAPDGRPWKCRAEKAEAALREYGRHQSGCLWRYNQRCSCGFEAALSAPEPGEEMDAIEGRE